MTNRKVNIENYLSKFDPLRRYPDYRNDFLKEIFFSNLRRLKYWTYCLFILSFILVYTDFIVADNFHPLQVRIFKTLDITIAVITVFLIIYTNFYLPKSKKQVTKTHKIIFLSYVFYQMLWCVGIAGAESFGDGGIPTLIVGILASATMFYLPSMFLGIMLITAIVVFNIYVSMISIPIDKIMSVNVVLYFLPVI